MMDVEVTNTNQSENNKQTHESSISPDKVDFSIIHWKNSEAFQKQIS